MFTGHYNEYNEYNSIKTKQKNNYAFLRTKLKLKKKIIDFKYFRSFITPVIYM